MANKGRAVAERGFTMIELMMVLAIFAILVAIAFPGFEGLTATSRLKGESNGFRQTLAQARTTAINRGQRVTVCKTDSQTSCNNGANWEDGWIMFVDADEDGARDGGEALLRVNQGMPDNLTLRVGANLADWVAFAPSGEPAGSGGPGNDTFRVCGPEADTGAAYQVVVNSIGRVEVRRGTGQCP